MLKIAQRGLKGLVASLAMLAGVAQAGAEGGVVTYGPDAAAVPTLSEWTLVGLGMLLVVLAYRVMRAQGKGHLMVNLLALGGAAAMGLGGHSLLGRAEAGVVVDAAAFLVEATGGVVQVPLYGSSVRVVNSTPVNQTIRSIAAAPGLSESNPSLSPRCTAGLRVPATSACYVRFDVSE